MGGFNTCNTNWQPWGWMDTCCTYNICEEPCNFCNKNDDSWELDLETIALIVLIVLGIALIITLVLPWILWGLGSI